eukprot:7375832-Prymnesium_polylepis.1
MWKAPVLAGVYSVPADRLASGGVALVPKCVSPRVPLERRARPASSHGRASVCGAVPPAVLVGGAVPESQWKVGGGGTLFRSRACRTSTQSCAGHLEHPRVLVHVAAALHANILTLPRSLPAVRA